MTDKQNGVLALDVGDVWIGVAVSTSGMIAQTLPPIRRTGRKAALNALEELVSRQGIGLILLGLPVLEGGAEGEQAEKTRAFGRSLQRRLPRIPIQYWDERYSTAEAREIAGPGPQPPGRVDSVAAAVILQEFLDQQARNRGKGPS